MGQLRSSVQAWIAADPDPGDRAELAALLRAGDTVALESRFGEPLTFGTAGIRGPLGAGPARMNRATVRRVAAGLAHYLNQAVPDQGGPVVIGYDARRGSREFADEAAAVLTGAGRTVLRLPGPVPTPVLAFAVRHLHAVAGVMVTASHNPREDNGVKVYWTDGAQIVPPVDAGIAAAAAAAGPLLDLPLGPPGQALGDEVTQAYLDAITAAVPPGGERERTELRIAYTPLHGVGLATARRAFAQAGFAEPAVVAEQAEPDGAFPTLPKPNPEEPGALDLLLAEATRTGADLALANDPDADRLAVALPDPAADSGWRVLTGDEIGALLGDHLLRHAADPARRLLVTTIVSAGLLGELAAAAGAAYAETLTGFKWIMRAADDPAVPPGHRFLFGYEEALGYAISDVVRDKDGMSAALVLAAAAAQARSHGQTLTGVLDGIARRFGLYATSQFSVDLSGGAEPEEGAGAALLAAARNAPPLSLLGQPLEAVDDLGLGLRSHADGTKDPLTLPRSDAIIWRAAARTRVAIRPSGTEPKVKIYLQVVLPVTDQDDLGPAGPLRAQAARRLADLRQEVSEVLHL
ncbi:MAG TPA: phospho-sugar mutase [Streptosporangiaceae bacterium]|jgi:phosphomannomutase